jgi:hypothetical protein
MHLLWCTEKDALINFSAPEVSTPWMARATEANIFVNLNARDHMTYKKASEEFAFLRERLVLISRLLALGTQRDLIEAAYLVGCLQSLCCENSVAFMESK